MHRSPQLAKRRTSTQGIQGAGGRIGTQDAEHQGRLQLSRRRPWCQRVSRMARSQAQEAFSFQDSISIASQWRVARLPGAPPRVAKPWALDLCSATADGHTAILVHGAQQGQLGLRHWSESLLMSRKYSTGMLRISRSSLRGLEKLRSVSRRLTLTTRRLMFRKDALDAVISSEASPQASSWHSGSATPAQLKWLMHLQSGFDPWPWHVVCLVAKPSTLTHPPARKER